MSLARLWQARGRREEARALLAPVVARYSEGLESRALRSAAMLLDELGRLA